MRQRPTNCPHCNSTKISLGEWYYKYGPDSRYMDCNSCGETIDCGATPEELIAEQEYWAKWEKEQEDKEKALYLKLKAKYGDL